MKTLFPLILPFSLFFSNSVFAEQQCISNVGFKKGRQELKIVSSWQDQMIEQSLESLGCVTISDMEFLTSDTFKKLISYTVALYGNYYHKEMTIAEIQQILVLHKEKQQKPKVISDSVVSVQDWRFKEFIKRIMVPQIGYLKREYNKIRNEGLKKFARNYEIDQMVGEMAASFKEYNVLKSSKLFILANFFKRSDLRLETIVYLFRNEKFMEEANQTIEQWLKSGDNNLELFEKSKLIPIVLRYIS